MLETLEGCANLFSILEAMFSIFEIIFRFWKVILVLAGIIFLSVMCLLCIIVVMAPSAQ